jgi:UDP-N-acetylmuramyl pentapeptide synthase
VRTPLGRAQLRHGLHHRAFPVLAPLAELHRRTLGRHTRVVAVVGSFGKTTSVRAVAAALGGVPHTALEANYYSFTAGAVLRLRPGQRYAVIEIGNHLPGQMASHVRFVRPDVAVVTRIGHDHPYTLGSLDANRREKEEVVRSLPRSGLAVLNGDDPNVRSMQALSAAPVRTFGLGRGLHVRAEDIALQEGGSMTFTLHADGLTRRVRTTLLGRHMLYPLLAATTVALAEGVSLTDIVEALEQVAPGPGRSEVRALPGGAVVVQDDLKSPAETIEAALDALSALPAERRLVVLGDVDEPIESEEELCGRLGRRVAEIATRAVFVGKSARWYADGAIAAGLSAGSISAVETAAGAVEALGPLGPDDVVLVKGADAQRLARVGLRLAGRAVGCDIPHCDAAATRCVTCPMLARGWDGHRVVI